MLNDRRLRYWLSAWFPVALGVAVIALESTEWMGADHTSGPLRWLFQAIFGPVSNARWVVLHSLIRKSGHFLGYGGIGLTWLRLVDDFAPFPLPAGRNPCTAGNSTGG